MKRRVLAVLAALVMTALPGSGVGATQPAPTWHVFASKHPAPLFYQAAGIATDASGNIFIADRGDHRVEKVSPAGKRLQVRGTDTPGTSRFSAPRAVAVDPSGNVYLADAGVVKLSPAGKVIGRWSAGALAQVEDVAVDRAGNIYALSLHPVPYTPVHDRLSVTRLSPAGRVLASWSFTYPQPAGDGLISAAIAVGPTGNVFLSIKGQAYCHSCDGTYYQLWTPSSAGKLLGKVNAPAGGQSVAVDGAGDVYVTAPGKVEKLGPDGRLLASWGTSGCGPLQFGNDLHLALGPNGSLYVADSQSVAIGPGSIVAPLRAGVIHVLSSSGAPLAFYGTCPAPARSKLFGQISGLAITSSGTVYVADEGYGRIDRFALNGAFQGSFAVQYPPFVSTDAQGNVYLADLQRGVLEKRSPTGALLGQVTSVEFEDVAVDRSGYVYGISGSGIVQVLRPVGSSRSATKPPPPPAIRRWQLKGYAASQGGLNPAGIAVDVQGNVYVSDTRFSHVQKFSASGKLLGYWGTRPGGALGQFRNPTGIAVDAHGHVYVLDEGNNRVQELDSNGKVLAVWGRKGQAVGQFIPPAGIALDAHGNLFLGDSGNDRIQMLAAGHR